MDSKNTIDPVEAFGVFLTVDKMMNGCSQSAIRIVSGSEDCRLKQVFYRTEFGVFPKTVEDLDRESILAAVERVKAFGRRVAQGAIDRAERDFIEERRKEFARAAESFRKMHDPHESGTVSEISDRLGISKSEVRRRKRDGSL